MSDVPSDFDAFAAAVTPALFRTAWALGGDWHLAQDLVQDTLLQVHLKWRRVQAADNPVAYVHTMVVRNFLSHTRRRRSRERPVHPLPDTAGPAPDTDLQLSLLQALQSLPPRDRAVLVLRYLDDQTAEQTATVLRSTAGAVRVRSHRALARLRDVLGTDPSDESARAPSNPCVVLAKEES